MSSNYSLEKSTCTSMRFTVKGKKATSFTNQTGEEFGEYLQSIRSKILDLDNIRASNKTHLIYCIKQDLKSKIRTVLNSNLTVFLDWSVFFENVTRIESSIHLQHKTTSNATKSLSQIQEKQADKSTDSNHNYGSSIKSQEINTRGNTHGQSQGRGGRKSPIKETKLIITAD